MDDAQQEPEGPQLQGKLGEVHPEAKTDGKSRQWNDKIQSDCSLLQTEEKMPDNGQIDQHEAKQAAP